MRWRIRSAVVAVSLVCLRALAAEEDVVRLAPLHVIPTENQSTRHIAADAPARVRLGSADPQALAKALGVSVAADQTSVEYVFGPYPQLRGPDTRTWLEPTFVIDFTEPAFEPLRKELAARGAKTTRPQLEEYVAGLIEESGERAWDLASVVAQRRRGDCSEHAVLTAALARLQGIPARVVVGVALVSSEKDFGTFGHAWTELLEDGKWQVADAALFDLEATVRYLPLGLIEDEGMGYAMELMRLMDIWIDRVVVLGP
jgi:transglutaminase-like putative cysteine protease